MRMNKIIILTISLSVISCATYKIVPNEDFNLIEFHKNKNISINIEKSNQQPGGLHCFEPMLFVLTLGIIPTHCVDTYNVTSQNNHIGHVVVTSEINRTAMLEGLKKPAIYRFENIL